MKYKRLIYTQENTNIEVYLEFYLKSGNKYLRYLRSQFITKK